MKDWECREHRKAILDEAWKYQQRLDTMDGVESVYREPEKEDIDIDIEEQKEEETEEKDGKSPMTIESDKDSGDEDYYHYSSEKREAARKDLLNFINGPDKALEVFNMPLEQLNSPDNTPVKK